MRGPPAPALNAERQRIFDRLVGGGWMRLPKDLREVPGGLSRWGSPSPRRVGDELVRLGRAVRATDGEHYCAVRYDAEAAARPDWVWLPNALVDGAAGEVPPVELVRQTASAPTLRLLVDLYAAQSLDEDGGVRFRHIRQEYERHRVGGRGGTAVWGFVPGKERAWGTAPFVVPHLAGRTEGKQAEEAWAAFWGCWNRLLGLGLVELVAHLVDADAEEGEVLFPVALEDTGLEVEREVRRAAEAAARALVDEGRLRWAERQGVSVLVPVPLHVEGAQVVGVARLRYRPRTARTRAFEGREAEWREVIARLRALEVRAAGSEDPP